MFTLKTRLLGTSYLFQNVSMLVWVASININWAFKTAFEIGEENTKAFWLYKTHDSMFTEWDFNKYKTVTNPLKYINLQYITLKDP